jgi:hypothetical protein
MVFIAVVFILSRRNWSLVYVPAATLNTTGPAIPQFIAEAAAAKDWKLEVLAGWEASIV